MLTGYMTEYLRKDLVKKPLLRVAREIFALVRIQYPPCLGGHLTILATGNGDVYRYNGYAAMIARNNEFHNTTDCITIDGYHPDHPMLVVKVGNQPTQEVYQYLRGIDGVYDVVYDVVKTNQSQGKGKYFIVCVRAKQQAAERTIHKVMKTLTFRITNICNLPAEKHNEQCPSLRSRLSQGGYTKQAAALDKEIYNPLTPPKPHTTRPYFDMMGLNLGTEDILDTPATASSSPNAWKTPHPTNQLALLGIHHPRYNDDRSLTSNNDASLANTLATFETNLTAVVATIFEMQNKEQAIERKDAAEAEAKREEQGKADNIVREQWYQDEVQQMEKLEERQEEKRATDQLQINK